MPTTLLSARTYRAPLLAALPVVVGLFAAGTARGTRAEDPVPSYSADELGTFFRRWLLCGPVPLGEQLDRTDYQHGPACSAFHRDLLAATSGERAADPRPDDEVTIDGRKYPWFVYQSPNDLIPLDKILRPNELVVAYAFCHVRASRPGKFVLSVGSNDGVKVWVNGQCVHEHHPAEGRWLQKDDDYVPIELRSGVNRLLIKIDEGSGDFGFVIRLLNYQKTVEKIETNVAVHKELSVVPEDNGVGAYFGRPYAVSLLNPDPNAQVTIDLLGGTGQRLATRSVRPGYAAHFPLADLPEGPLSFRAHFPVGDGKHLTSTIRYYHGKLPRHGVVGMLRDRAMIDASGQPWLPIGFYSAPRSTYKKLEQAGVNFVVAGGADLDAAHKAGLKVGVSLHGQGDGWRDHIRETVKKFRGHPALLFWMMVDEPAFNRADLLDVHAAYELLYELDPVHPSYLVITRPDGYRTFGRCCDLLAIDTYPVSRGDYRYVGERVKRAYRLSSGDQPVWHCGQLFAWPSDRPPTPGEHRYMTYTSLMAGAKGFLWYAYQHAGWTLPDDDPPLWQAHLRLLAELSELAPVIVAPGLPEPVDVQGGDDTVHAVIKVGPKSTFLFAANDGRSGDVSCTLSVPTEGVSEVAVYGENRTLRAEQGKIRDTFGPLDVHIYRLDPGSPPSSHGGS